MCASIDTSRTGDALAEVVLERSLRVATDPKYKPQSWFDVQGPSSGKGSTSKSPTRSPAGSASRRHPPGTVELVTAGSWNNRWDVSVGSMTDTVDRESLFYFTPAYYYTPAVISVSNDNSTIKPVRLTSPARRCASVCRRPIRTTCRRSLELDATFQRQVRCVDNPQIITFDHRY